MPPTSSLHALYHRVRHLAICLAISAFALIALLYCSLRAYTSHMAHRAITLLDEAARIPVGSTEDSVLPLVARYGGVKRSFPPPIPTDDCVDKSDCAYQNAHIPDYAYDVGLSPFRLFSPREDQTGRVHHVLSVLMTETPSSWRYPFSLRDWMVYVTIPIRAGHVDGVDSGLFVEGRNRWLGNIWRLSAEMPRLDMRSNAYAVEGTYLTFTGNGGAGTVHYLTPAATPEQFQAARSFNARCITGLVPCRCLSDLNAAGFQYLNHHPEAGSSVTTDDCPNTLSP